MRLRWSGMTHPGRFRRNNEDAFLGLIFDAREVHYLGKEDELTVDDNKQFVFAVSDGMGGANAGEYASRIAVQTVTKRLPEALRSAMHGDAEDDASILRNLFQSIHLTMLDMGRAYEECNGMGATLSMVWINPQRLLFAHIGDSRIYHLPVEGRMQQVTEDHSHVGWLLRQGRINERQAKMHPSRNILDQALGGGIRKIDPQIGSIGVVPGDTFALCSDGICDGLFDHAITDIIRNPHPRMADKRVSQRLVDEALANSGKDNLTALVVSILEL